MAEVSLNLSYNPQQFSPSFKNNHGAEIWGFLLNEANLIRMETASYLSRPAAEPLSPALKAFIKQHNINENRQLNQMIGHMIKQILEPMGYKESQKNVRIRTQDNMFKSASRYKKIEL